MCALRRPLARCTPQRDIVTLGAPCLRPPGAVAEERFLRLCVRCGKCALACPYGSIELAGGFGRARRTPRVTPRRMPCYLCMKCPPACPSGALDPGVTTMPRAGMGMAWILKDRCHNFTDGTICMTCHDRCPLRGTAIVLANGLVPAVTTACVGCGVCDYVCPVRAVEIVPRGVAHVPSSGIPPRPVSEGTPQGGGRP